MTQDTGQDDGITTYGAGITVRMVEHEGERSYRVMQGAFPMKVFTGFDEANSYAKRLAGAKLKAHPTR